MPAAPDVAPPWPPELDVPAPALPDDPPTAGSTPPPGGGAPGATSVLGETMHPSAAAPTVNISGRPAIPAPGEIAITHRPCFADARTSDWPSLCSGASKTTWR